MKLDLDTQSFMQNTFTIFSARVRNIYLFWWQHFDIISNFLFNKLFSLFSNISSFSFKPREYLFDWGLYARNWFFTAHVGLEFPAFKFQYSTDSFVSFLYLDVEWFFMVCVSVFKCVFTNSFIISGLLIPFVRLYCRYKLDVFRRQFPFKGQVFLMI